MNPIATNSSQIYRFEWSFEKEFDSAQKGQWMKNNWHLSIYASIVYFFIIHGGQIVMANRQPFRLKSLLTAWNISLALFSIIGASRTLPEMFYVLKHGGFTQSVCDPSFMDTIKPSAFWTWLFVLSKLPELGDTIFIVLRKQKLIFLHWYHHITVLTFCWYFYSDNCGPARWFVNMNYSVHAVMYSYYALKALRVRVPKQIAMIITTAQISQMAMAGYVILHAYYFRNKVKSCRISNSAVTGGLYLFGSYFILFAHFFYKSYLHSSSSEKKPEAEGTHGSGSQKKGQKSD